MKACRLPSDFFLLLNAYSSCSQPPRPASFGTWIVQQDIRDKTDGAFSQPSCHAFILFVSPYMPTRVFYK